MYNKITYILNILVLFLHLCYLKLRDIPTRFTCLAHPPYLSLVQTNAGHWRGAGFRTIAVHETVQTKAD